MTPPVGPAVVGDTSPEVAAVTASALGQLAVWAARLRFDDVPGRVRDLAASQVLSQLAAVRTGSRQGAGRRLVGAFGPPLQDDARTGACVLAGVGAWLNLDDTAYAGHLSSSTVGVPLAFAHARGLDGRSLLTAVIAANECAARLTAAATLGSLRGQSAIHSHLVGGVVGRLVCEAAPAPVIAHALSLALGQPHWPLLHAFLASDSRLLATFAPVRAAMDACDAAYAGLRGALDVVEHADGFLARFASVPVPGALVDGLGRRWHTDTLSFKMHPGGPGIDAAIDCAAEIHGQLGPVTVDDVVDVEVAASLYTVFANRVAERNGAGPGAPLGVLVLHVPYAVATTLLHGHLDVADVMPPHSGDPRRWRLAARVRVVEDRAMTRDLLASTAPFGEAVRAAGPGAAPWLRAFGGDELVRVADELGGTAGEDFSRATKATGARVAVRLADGRNATRERRIPHGAAGPHTRAHHAELVQEKFMALGGSRAVARAAPGLPAMSAEELRHWISAALR